MKSYEFLKIADSQINNNPLSRLSENVKNAIENEECILDIHTHIFDKKCLSVAFILLRMLKSKIFETSGLEFFEEDSLLTRNEEEIYTSISDNELSNEHDWEKLESELERIVELTEKVELFGYDLKQAFKVLKKKNMKEVHEFYLKSFSLLNLPDFQNNPFVTGILMMDLETGWGIKPKKKMFQQIVEMKLIIKEKCIIPFLPLDPRRCGKSGKTENLYELFLNAFTDKEYPFFGVKCYPALGYLPSDLRLDPIFKICAEKKIPVMTHCGGEIVSTFKKSFEYQHNDGITDFQIPGTTRIERARYLNDPSHWEPVLNKHKDLKLCFGHFGGDWSWQELSNNGSSKRIQKIVEMMRNPEWSIFTDFSFNVVEKELFEAFQSFLNNNSDLCPRIMFGTDYWVVLPAGDLLQMQDSFIKKMKGFERNLLNTAPMNYLIN